MSLLKFVILVTKALKHYSFDSATKGVAENQGYSTSVIVKKTNCELFSSHKKWMIVMKRELKRKSKKETEIINTVFIRQRFTFLHENFNRWTLALRIFLWHCNLCTWIASWIMMPFITCLEHQLQLNNYNSFIVICFLDCSINAIIHFFLIIC